MKSALWIALLSTAWICPLADTPKSRADDDSGLRPAHPGLAVGSIESAKAAVPAHRLKYRSSELVVDLGVGLWAWPLPMDFDDDGDLDLVVSCPDVPYAGTYFFENPGDSDGMPIFRPAVRVGPKLSNPTVSYVDGKPRVLVPGRELVDFRASGFETSIPIYPQSNIHENRVRANQWRYVDYDGDQNLDLVVGVGDWTEYGWDDAFDEQGRWTRGPLHGFVYLLRNAGTNDRPQYADPVKVEAAGKPVDVYGMPSPNFADFDFDGDLDLLCGEFLDGFTYFQNTGTRTQPAYAAGRRLQHAGQPLAMDLQMIIPVAIDFDGDGDTDLVVGDEDGRVAFVEHTGEVDNGLPRFLPPRYFRQRADEVKFGALVTPVSFDWDGDGDEDLVCGNTAGYVGLIENLDGGLPPRWAAPRLLEADGRTIRVQAGSNGSIQGPCEAKWGYTTLDVADWNHDGLPDIVINSIWGKVQWYQNVGERHRPKLAAAQPIEVAWPDGSQPPKPAWNWWRPAGNELVTQWRTKPIVIDLDRDGLNDLVMLDHEGYLAFYRRHRDGNRLSLQPGERIFRDANDAPLQLNPREAGRSGRRKICFADWDGDGRLDLLVNGRNVDFWRNISTDERPWTFQMSGPLDKRHLAGHTTSPTVVNWNGDEKPDLLIGAEDGRLYYLPNNYGNLARQETADFILELRHVKDGVLDNGRPAFANRSYEWYDVPAKLRGWRTTQTFGGEPCFVAAEAKRDTMLYLATARARKSVDLKGWEQVEDLTFGYTDRGRTRMDVFRRAIRAGDRLVLPQGNWSGSLLLMPPAP